MLFHFKILILLIIFNRWWSCRSDAAGQTEESASQDLPLLYNWTEVERYDPNDLRLWLRGLRPFTHYEILIQAFNQFGKGPMAKAKAVTLSDGEAAIYFSYLKAQYYFEQD